MASRNAEIVLPLGSEDRLFRLGLAQERAIEEKCDAGLAELAQRLAPMMRLAMSLGEKSADDRRDALLVAIMGGALGTYRVDDYREVIYQGLIGGGMANTIAGLVVQTEVDGQAPMQGAVTAFQIIMNRLLGVAAEPLGETKPPATSRRKKPSQTARPAGQTSTAPAL